MSMLLQGGAVAGIEQFYNFIQQNPETGSVPWSLISFDKSVTKLLSNSLLRLLEQLVLLWTS